MLNGPVPECLRLVHGKETAGSQRLELTGCQRGEPQVTIARNCRFPEVGTHGSQPGNNEVTIASNCRFPEVGTHASQPGNHTVTCTAFRTAPWTAPCTAPCTAPLPDLPPPWEPAPCTAPRGAQHPNYAQHYLCRLRLRHLQSGQDHPAMLFCFV